MTYTRLAPVSRSGLCLFLLLVTAHCRGYFSSGTAEVGSAAVIVDSSKGSAAGTAGASSSGVSSTGFDAGPLSPTSFVSPPARSGFLSPVAARDLCVAANANAVSATPCTAQNVAQISLGFERLVLGGNCMATTRPSVDMQELMVTLTPCDGSDPNQRFGYKGGAFFWGQNPNRCLDASHLVAGDGPLVAKMCDGSGNQTFWMHSSLSDEQPALGMGPPDLFMPMGNGFLGSDAGATMPLDFNRTLFLFNDTYVNQQKGNSRANINGFVHNTVGVMACTDLVQTEGCTIKFYFGGQQDYTQAIFTDPNASFYFWPTTGYAYDGSLYVINQRTVSSSEGLGFSAVGIMVGRISNPQDTPDLWDKQQFDVTYDGNFKLNYQLAPMQMPTGTWTAAADDGQFAYYYFTLGDARGMMRMPYARLADPNAYLLDTAPAWQYLDTKNTWAAWPSGGKQPTDVLAAAAPTGALGNINYDANSRLYYFIGQSDNLFVERGTYWATAPTASGPWTAAKLLYQPPQYDAKSSAYIAGCSCYASEAHPEMSPPGQVAFTYQCNGSDPSNPLINRQNLVVVPTPW